MSYEVEGREIDFSPMNAKDVLKAKNAVIALSVLKNTNGLGFIEANQVLDDLAFKYLKIRNYDGKWIENIDMDDLVYYFKEESSIIKISLLFVEKVKELF